MNERTAIPGMSLLTIAGSSPAMTTRRIESIGEHALSPLRSVGLHKLKGDRKHQWAMTVNARWRICFEFRKGDAHDVEIVDYHRG
jgi:plasmid maintenance system killer protein